MGDLCAERDTEGVDLDLAADGVGGDVDGRPATRMPALLSRTSRASRCGGELLEGLGPLLLVAHVEGAGDPLGVVALTLARPSASTSYTPTVQPSRENRSAVARLIPAAPPVMKIEGIVTPEMDTQVLTCGDCPVGDVRRWDVTSNLLASIEPLNSARATICDSPHCEANNWRVSQCRLSRNRAGIFSGEHVPATLTTTVDMTLIIDNDAGHSSYGGHTMTIAMERDFGGTDAADLGTPTTSSACAMRAPMRSQAPVGLGCPALAQRDDRDRLVGTSGPQTGGLQP